MPVAADPADLYYTWHATERMRTLRIDRHEIEQAVRDPLYTWPGRPGRHGASRHYVGRHIIVLLGGDGLAVITVKLRTATPYVHGTHTRDDMPGPALSA